MIKLFASVAASLLIFGGVTVSAHAAEHTYKFDPNHSDIIVTWVHHGFAQPSAMFNQINGTVTYDPEHPTQASVEATIPVSSVHTSNPALDKHIMSADFFDAAKYPNITFKSTSVAVGDTPQSLKVMGNLTMHGKTAPATLDVTINKVGEMRGRPQIAFNATTTLKRSDFGVDMYSSVVSDEVKLTLTAGASAEK